MKTTIKIALLLLGASIISCSNQTNELPSNPILDIQNDKVDLSGSIDTFVTDIQITALETTPEGLIADRANSIITTKDGKLILITKGFNAALIFFDLTTGKFIKKIQPSGEGPGEFNSIKCVTYNPFQNEVEIFSSFQQKEVIVSTDGNFIRETLVKADYEAKHYLTKDKVIYSYRHPNAAFFKTNTSFQLAMYNKVNNTWSTFLEADEKVENIRDFHTNHQFNTSISGIVTWFKPFSNQTFIVTENKIVPSYSINFSHNQPPATFWNNNFKYKSLFEAFRQANFPFLGFFYMETENLVLLPYQYDDGIQLFAYDKKAKKTIFNAYRLKIDKLDTVLEPSLHICGNNLLYLISAFNFSSFIQNHPNPSLLPKAFHDIHKTLKPTDNPVLMIIKLK